MKTALLAFALASFFGTTANAAPTATPTATASADILVPAGTAVPVHVVGSVNSGSAKPGDIFEIQCSDDVVVDGMIVIRRGAGGQGTIVSSDSAGGNGHSGSLSFTFDYIYSADGGKIRLSQTPQKQTEDDRKGASSTATIIGFATFGIGGLFGHNLAHGRQKSIDEKTVLSAFVADTIHVAALERSTERFDR